MTPAAETDDPILKGLFLPIHATLAFFGYAALFVAFAMGLLYLIQERELKSRSPHRFYYIVPSLERCDTIGGRSVEVGFGFLTLAIVTGMLWSHRARGVYWTGDAREWEAMILSTCNRVELYGRGEQAEEAARGLEEFLCAFHRRPREDVAPYLYRLAGPDAVRHAFRVAASLESMVIGEPQILGQVKEAY